MKNRITSKDIATEFNKLSDKMQKIVDFNRGDKNLDKQFFQMKMIECIVTNNLAKALAIFTYAIRNTTLNKEDILLLTVDSGKISLFTLAEENDLVDFTEFVVEFNGHCSDLDF